MLKQIIISFSIILLIEIVFHQTEWNFINASITSSNIIITSFSFFGILYCLILLLRPSNSVAIFLALIFLLVTSFISLLLIYPLDSTSQPVDITILHTNSDGKKLIVREKINLKHNYPIRDTILVKDIFIFRQICKRTK